MTKKRLRHIEMPPARHPEDKVVGWQLLQVVDVTKNLNKIKFQNLCLLATFTGSGCDKKFQSISKVKTLRHIEMYFQLKTKYISR